MAPVQDLIPRVLVASSETKRHISFKQYWDAATGVNPTCALQNHITMTSYMIVMASQTPTIFVQQLVQGYNKENIKVLHYGYSPMSIGLAGWVSRYVLRWSRMAGSKAFGVRIGFVLTVMWRLFSLADWLPRWVKYSPRQASQSSL